MDLDDILDGKTEEVAESALTEAPTEPEKEPEEVIDEAPEETKPEEPTGEKEGEPPSPNTDERVAAFQAKAQDEKRKRQELEARLAAVETKPKHVPDVFEDQQGFQGHVLEEVQSASLNTKLELSEFFARRDNPDMDDKLEKYKELVDEGVVDHQKTLSSQSPWHTIADIVDKNEKLSQLDNIDDWREQEKAKIRQEVEAEFKAKATEKESKLSAIQPSLANTGSAPVSAKTWSGPTPLDNMLN